MQGKAALAGALLLAGFGIQLGVFVYGWGLDPVSWGWIIGGYVGSLIAFGTAQSL